MKALVLKNGGSIDGLQIADMPIPEFQEDELLIRVKATSLNPSDYQTAEYMTGENLDIVLGLDVAGVVEKTGKNCQKYKPGDRVFFLREIANPYGGFAEYAIAPEKFVCKVPDELSFVEAAVLPGAGFTAYHILEQRFHLIAGRTILIQGGAGAVGSYAIQLAKLHGLRVITTCLGRDIPYVLELGADEAIDFQNENVYERISLLTQGQGVHYVLSTIGSDGATKDLSILRFNGELAVTSGLPDFKDWVFYNKGISIHEIAFGQFLSIQDKEMNRVPVEIGERLAKLVVDHQIRLPKIQKILLEETINYLKEIKAGNITGKVVIEFNDD